MSSEQFEQMAILVNVEAREGDVPTEILLIPDGEVRSTAGDFICDEESERLIQEAFTRHGTDLPIDYEHGTLGGAYATRDGVAPAAGWIKAIVRIAGKGIVATVEWTKRALDYLKNREYRYLSPVTLVRKVDRKVVALHSVALTNKPAIVGMMPIVNRDRPVPITPPSVRFGGDGNQKTPEMKGKIMEEFLAKLKEKLGLPEDADPEAILLAVQELVDKLKGAEEGAGEAAEVASKVRTALGLKDGASVDEILVVCGNLRNEAGAAKRVNELEKKLAAIEEDQANRAAEALVQEFVVANKINPKDKNHMTVCTEAAKKDPAQFKKLMAGVTPYARPGGMIQPSGGDGSAPKNEDELIAHALKEHDGKTGAALTALQSKLIHDRVDQGMSRKAAIAVLEGEYPKIFGSTA